ncbi:acyl-CoA dehydrogenase family protein [Actinosynnema sp. NPDC053489]|uniref:acyl-CoA dehydrogenase family protein n=1 Tax=Actinosynnema sp. NPDC053489 TaxID=3363916 RepID=UPI0037C884E8
MAVDFDEALSLVREFVRDELVADPPDLDALADMPLPVYERFAKTGLMNWWLHPDLGGHGLGLEQSVDLVSELSYGDAGVAFTLFISIMATNMVWLYGSDELKRRYLEPLAANGGFGATLGSEEEAGSELGRTATEAVRDGAELVLTGEKWFSTNTEFADFLVVIAKSADHPSGHVAVVVPKDTPGVRVVKRWNVLGLRASGTYQVTLDGARVPASHALNGPGLRILEVGLNASRVLIATTAIGISRRIRDLSIDYARTKSLRGSTLLNNAVFAAKIGQVEMAIGVMRNQCAAAGREFDAIMGSGPSAGAEFLRQGTLKSALASKMFTGQAGWQVATVGSELFGALGYTGDAPIGKLVRDMRYVSIVEGGDDVLRDLMFNRYALPEGKRY